MKQIIYALKLICTILFNIVIITQIHQELYGSLKEKKFQLIMLILMLIMVFLILNHLNLRQRLWEEQQQILLMEIAL